MKTILIIEDSLEIRENISEMLELEGYTVKCATNGQEGITEAQTLSPDLILCDILMDKLNGFDVLAVLKQTECTKHIPFIFMSAISEKREKLAGMSMGAINYLVKPFSEEELIESIKLVLFPNLPEQNNFYSAPGNPYLETNTWHPPLC